MLTKGQATTVAFSTSKSRVLHGRSGLENTTMEDLAQRGVQYRYEEVKVAYTSPATAHKYTPDFIIPNGVIVETKGIFDSDDRKKHLLIQAQNPGLDIRFVFSRSKSTLTKRVPKTHKNYATQTTYGDWCTKHGFLFADKLIPQAWIDEPSDPLRHAAIASATP
jgi:hypothetical protein